MTDQHSTDHAGPHETAALTAAFAELESRADRYADQQAAEPTRIVAARQSRRRPLLVAASVAVVAGVAVAVVAVADGGSGGSGGAPAGAAGGVVSSARPTSDAPSVTAAERAKAAAAQAALAKAKASASAAAARKKAIAGVPKNAQQVADRLKAVLGDSATFTWHAAAGKKAPVISGILTNSKTGASGGFDIQTMILSPGDSASCEDADLAGCTIRKLPNGDSLWVGKETQGGVLYLIDLVHPDGVDVHMHVSNLSDPKGGGQTLGATPPLTTKQAVAIVESPLWEVDK